MGILDPSKTLLAKDTLSEKRHRQIADGYRLAVIAKEAVIANRHRQIADGYRLAVIAKEAVIANRLTCLCVQDCSRCLSGNGAVRPALIAFTNRVP